MNYQNGSGILSNISTLTLPLGLAKLATIDLNSKDKSTDKKSTNKQQSKNKKGGAFAENILIEAGLSVVPFGLIASLEYFGENDKKTLSDPKNKINKK